MGDTSRQYPPPTSSSSYSQRIPDNDGSPQMSRPYLSASTNSRLTTPFPGEQAGTGVDLPPTNSSRGLTPFGSGLRPGTRVSLPIPPSSSAGITPFNGSRPATRASTSNGRPSTSSGRKSLKAPSSLGTREPQEILCALSEGRGITPSVGVCFINVSTGEVLLSQIGDNQFYVKTIHKIRVNEPSRILILATACPPSPKSTLYSLIEEHVAGANLVPLDRRFWSESAGLDYIQELAFKEDAEAVKVAIEGNFYTICSFAAAVKYLESEFQYRIVPHSLRIRYQPSEDTMMIDISAIQSLELIQNLRDSKSKDCLLGLLNQTLTPMGARMLRNNILQPPTLADAFMVARYDAVEELSTNEDLFGTVRKALKGFMDVEKLLTKLIIVAPKPSMYESEQAINSVLMIKQFLESVPLLFEALAPARSALLSKVRELCRREITEPPLQLFLNTIHPDVTYMKSALELRNQRTFAVKSGRNGFLDVARQTYQEGTSDAMNHVEELQNAFNIDVALKYEAPRLYYLKLKAADFEDRPIPDVLINQVRKKGVIECQTLTLKKLNQRIADSAAEVTMQSDKVIQELLDCIRTQVPHLFRVCESVALLDMMAAFAQLSTMRDYVRPTITDTLALKTAKHPLLERKLGRNLVPNDYYATEAHRFQIITGPNMSGKTTYIRNIALLQIMAQIGCFVPAEYAAFPVVHNIFARVTTDDSIESNLSTFSVEMREMAFILRNVDNKSIAIIDELGRGTSTRDGLSIALAMSEALIQSGAMVWFATHFTELAGILSDRPGVMNLHLATSISRPKGKISKMTMLYKVASGPIKEDNYGIALAKAMGFPDSFIDFAEHVSNSIRQQREAKKESSESAKLVQRRKLILNLDETLNQVLNSGMDHGALFSYLERLQEEFVTRMEAIEGDGEREEVDEGEAMEVEVDDLREDNIDGGSGGREMDEDVFS